jgi:hypothetical protein
MLLFFFFSMKNQCSCYVHLFLFQFVRKKIFPQCFVDFFFNKSLNETNTLNSLYWYFFCSLVGLNADEVHTVGQQMENILHVPRRVLVATCKESDAASIAVSNYGSGEERIYKIRQVRSQQIFSQILWGWIEKPHRNIFVVEM